jgi:hypothetical protein
MKGFLFFILTILMSTCCADQTIKNFLSKGENGDYIVARNGKMVNIILIKSILPEKVILEEISAPYQKIASYQDCWNQWVLEKAPHHSSWSIIEIDLKEGTILECYSFSRNTYIQLSPSQSMLASLLQLPLKEVPDRERKKIGPKPPSDESDFRKTWQPPFVFEGKPIEKATFKVMETSWPNDESELAGRVLTLYFDQEMKIPLPLWIDVETSHAIGHFHVIDSGKNLQSPLKKRSDHFKKRPSVMRRNLEGEKKIAIPKTADPS